MHSEKTEVVVVGAGASGLSMAHALRERGVRDVVVLEKSPGPGGKCCTLNFEGRTYELGAAIVTPAYRRVNRLMKAHGVRADYRFSAAYMRASDGMMARRPLVPPVLKGLDFLRLGVQSLRSVLGELGEQRMRFPRLDEVPEHWAMPFSQFCHQHGFSELLELVRPWATSFGYGFMEEVPAAYMINYLCVFGPSYELKETGYGGLWERVARTLDVRSDTGVERVERHDDGVRVFTNRGVFEADRIVIASPFDQALSFLDASDEERDLFSRIRVMDYQTICLDTTGMPAPAYTFLPDNFGPEARSRPMFYYRRFQDTGVITFYSFKGAGGLDGAEHEARMLVDRVGGRTKKVLARKAWRYFPHVSSQDFARGFYPRIEAMQGVRRTFYTGEVLSFSCVEPVVAYSELLASRVAYASRAVLPRDLPFSPVENDSAHIGRVVNQ